MTEQAFELLLSKFVPYKDRIEFLTIHGCGEPLLDYGLPQKIATAKLLGFRGTGFATNCTELRAEMARKLIDAGLDTIICSIDGIKKETHEAIRRRTRFEDVVENVRRFIDIRDQKHGRTRVLIRFIRQQINYDEWPVFQEQWQEYLDPSKGDDIIRFDAHNWGNKVENYEHISCDATCVEPLICSDLFERLYIYSDGRVALCCADDNGFFDLGNAFESDPIEIYNNKTFTDYRSYMVNGRIAELPVCKTCTIVRSRLTKTKAAS